MTREQARIYSMSLCLAFLCLVVICNGFWSGFFAACSVMYAVVWYQHRRRP